jgi:hypothetical protein
MRSASSKTRIDRRKDFRSIIEISKAAPNHWPEEICSQLSYTLRRMSSYMKSSEGSSRVPNTSPEQESSNE